MAERDALVKTDHPFIMRLHYSFQVSLLYISHLCRTLITCTLSSLFVEVVVFGM